MDEKIILEGENIKITSENSIFKIEFKYAAYPLVNSLIKTRLIQGGSTDETYKRIRFKAGSVKTLDEFKNDKMISQGRKNLLVSDVANMVRSLSLQLNYLISHQSHTIIGYNLEDIIVINDETFAFLGSEFVAKIDAATEMAMISCPFKPTDFFFSPEMFEITELPAYVHFKSSYFSLACLVINLLLGDDEYYSEYIKDKQSANILEYLNNHPIKETKLYWLLSRCLVEQPNNRSILLI